VPKKNLPLPDPDADWWVTDEVAAYLDVDPGTVRGFLARGEMPMWERKFGRSNVWRPATIIEWDRTRPRVGGTDRLIAPETP
jgi:hypothetical protein